MPASRAAASGHAWGREPCSARAAGGRHLGLDGAERQGQVAAILDAIGDTPDAVLLGDLNEVPGEPAIGALAAVFHDAWVNAGQGDGFTIPAGVPERRIDYVLLGSAWQTATAARVLDTQVSDHRPLVVDAALVPVSRGSGR